MLLSLTMKYLWFTAYLLHLALLSNGCDPSLDNDVEVGLRFWKIKVS